MLRKLTVFYQRLWQFFFARPWHQINMLWHNPAALHTDKTELPPGARFDTTSFKQMAIWIAVCQLIVPTIATVISTIWFYTIDVYFFYKIIFPFFGILIPHGIFFIFGSMIFWLRFRQK